MNDSIPLDKQQYNPSHTKWCPRCKGWLPFKDFSPSKGKKDGLYYCCKKCHNKYNRDSYDSSIARDRQLRANYDGFNQKQYDKMFDAQCGVCKICGHPETRKLAGRNAKSQLERIVPLAVDHDHDTDDVRALLCHDCNAALGHMHENPERIQKLKEYAEWCKSREPDVKIIQLRLVD